jgi:hypothetical protein
MSWHPDIPDFLNEKPREIEILEEFTPEMMNAMTGLEVNEHIENAAHALAKSYYNFCQNRTDYGYDECVMIVSGALSELGASLDCKLGTTMVAESISAAKKASREYFPEGE